MTGTELDGVFSGWQQASFSFLSDHVYNWSDLIGGKYIYQPFWALSENPMDGPF
jgi:hypothetical protein